jgi:hypothetical protein
MSLESSFNSGRSYDVKDFPYSQFEKVGLKKDEVLKLDRDTIQALMSGVRTPLMELRVNVDDLGPLQLNAKLSLREAPDGSLMLHIHPVRKDIQNDFNLPQKDLRRLEEGEILVRPVVAQNGNKESRFIQLDRDNNELLSTQVKNVIIPDRLALPLAASEKGIGTSLSNERFVKLTTEDKDSLRKGEVVFKQDPTGGGNQLAISINLNSVRGLDIQTIETFKMSVDPQIMANLARDKNQNEVNDRFEKDINRNGIPDSKEVYMRNQQGVQFTKDQLAAIPSRIENIRISDDQKRELLLTGKTTVNSDGQKATLAITNDLRSLEITRGDSRRLVGMNEVSLNIKMDTPKAQIRL